MKTDAIPSKWVDLAPRVISAVVMVAVAAVALWVGGWAYYLMIAAIIGLCMWELARLLRPSQSAVHIFLGLAAFFGVFILAYVAQKSADPQLDPRMSAIFLAPALGAILISDRRLLFLAYSLAIMLAALAFVLMDASWVLVFFVMIIVSSDVAGYFVGRMMGGPKFWPRISPKKTWSGTIAGWVGACFVGLLGVWMGVFSPIEALIAPFVALAGQMGDIAQSAIKRSVGVKDSSNLIPGHGGVLDRFDAMIGAGALVSIAGLILAAVN